MDYNNIIWIKAEVTDEISTEADSAIREAQLVNSESKKKPELNLGLEETENILCVPEFHPQIIKEECLEDPLVISGSLGSIKEPPELNLEAEESENFVLTSANDSLDVCDPLSVTDDEEAASKRCARDSPRLTKVASEAGSFVFDETYQGTTDVEVP
ncbi:uncharacterized protein LOC126213198 isoform X3 [Schistocerca nitens]|uniref:uncharacterized protein LOC126213198 isoform X3 n=1 Tax=Schistocerca nitens TaxID=7011 RepID=UPI00211854CE|nr:uncharacterized protein LOC126213198 isoform X3 [Schistocerca nitens]